MSITREQVADLQPGDVVRVTIEGPLVRSVHGELLLPNGQVLTWSDGSRASWVADHDLTVISRAPRPLYINHPRTEAHVGDVARDADSESSRTVFLYTGDGSWGTSHGHAGFTWCGTASRLEVPARLRLLVDGETGRVVP